MVPSAAVALLVGVLAASPEQPVEPAGEEVYDEDEARLEPAPLPALPDDIDEGPAEHPEILEADPEDAPWVRIVLTDGQVLRGRLLAEAPLSLHVEVAGARLHIPRSAVARVVHGREKHTTLHSGELVFPDPNRTRYFYAPSAIPLSAGEIYFSQKMLFFSSVAYGLTDNVSVLAGAAIPFWFIEFPESFNFLVGAKAGLEITEAFHIAAGAQVFLLPELVGVALPFVGGTFGEANGHVTVNVGVPTLIDRGVDLGPLTIVVAGNLRVHRNVALITENWIMPFFLDAVDLRDLYMMGSAGARIMGEHIAVDLGFVLAMEVPIPIPWLSFTYNWH